MSGEMMLFPATVEEFMEQYKVVDRDHALSNGAEFVPVFRMRQWFDHLQAQPVTNADRIRAMSDEELAIHFSATTCPSKEAREKCVTYGQYEDDGCVQCWLDWLKQEVSTDGN